MTDQKEEERKEEGEKRATKSAQAAYLRWSNPGIVGDFRSGCDQEVQCCCDTEPWKRVFRHKRIERRGARGQRLGVMRHGS